MGAWNCSSVTGKCICLPGESWTAPVCLRSVGCISTGLCSDSGSFEEHKTMMDSPLAPAGPKIKHNNEDALKMNRENMNKSEIRWLDMETKETTFQTFLYLMVTCILNNTDSWQLHKLTSQIWGHNVKPWSQDSHLALVWLWRKTVSLGKYALLSSSCPEEGRLGVTQHNIITPREQLFQRATDLQEIRIFPHQRKLIMPLNLIQTSLREAHQHVFSNYVQTSINMLMNFTWLCLCVSDKDRLSPVNFYLVICRSKCI